jgi:hypothetical protein
MAKPKKRRKRRPSPTASAAAPAASVPKPAVPGSPRKPIDEQRPAAPWGSFPLVEVAVLSGLVLFVIGFFFVAGPRGTQLFATGLGIASLAGLELSIREHFAGYRSHSLLLAGVGAVATILGLYYVADLPPTVSLLGGALVMGLGFWALASAFRRRSGRLVKLR